MQRLCNISKREKSRYNYVITEPWVLYSGQTKNSCAPYIRTIFISRIDIYCNQAASWTTLSIDNKFCFYSFVVFNILNYVQLYKINKHETSSVVREHCSKEDSCKHQRSESDFFPSFKGIYTLWKSEKYSPKIQELPLFSFSASHSWYADHSLGRPVGACDFMLMYSWLWLFFSYCSLILTLQFCFLKAT